MAQAERFAGSFGLETAEQVCSGAGLERERIVDLVGSLVGKSILTMARRGRRGRYRLLETLRLYGEQRLAEAGEDVEQTSKHARWYAERVSGGDRPWWARPGQREGFETLDVEWRTSRRRWTSSRASAADAGLGLRMAGRSVALLARARPLPGRHRPSRGAPGDRAGVHSGPVRWPCGRSRS